MATELPLGSPPLPAAFDYAEVPGGESGNQPGEGVCGSLGPGLASVAAAFNRRVLAWPAQSLLSAPAALGIGMCPTRQVLAETSCWSEFFSVHPWCAGQRTGGGEGAHRDMWSSKCHQLRPQGWGPQHPLTLIRAACCVDLALALGSPDVTWV